MRFLIGLIAVLGLAACGGSGAPRVLQQVNESGPLTRIETKNIDPATSPRDIGFSDLLNNARIDNGAGKVVYNAQLNTAAQDHAADMVAQNYLSHTGKDGSDIVARAEAAGYTNWTFLAENIAQGSNTEGQVFDRWQNDSKTHRDAQMDPRAEDFGLGVSGKGTQTRWVLILGAQR